MYGILREILIIISFLFGLMFLDFANVYMVYLAFNNNNETYPF